MVTYGEFRCLPVVGRGGERVACLGVWQPSGASASSTLEAYEGKRSSLLRQETSLRLHVVEGFPSDAHAEGRLTLDKEGPMEVRLVLAVLGPLDTDLRAVPSVGPRDGGVSAFLLVIKGPDTSKRAGAGCGAFFPPRLLSSRA